MPRYFYGAATTVDDVTTDVTTEEAATTTTTATTTTLREVAVAAPVDDVGEETFIETSVGQGVVGFGGLLTMGAMGMAGKKMIGGMAASTAASSHPYASPPASLYNRSE